MSCTIADSLIYMPCTYSFLDRLTSLCVDHESLFGGPDIELDVPNIGRTENWSAFND